MSAIMAAACRPENERRASDTFKLKAGHMLTFDRLSLQRETSERHVLKKVVRTNINRFAGCMALPITLGYFFFFSLALRFHEDITMVFLVESEFRMRIEADLDGVETIPAVWDYLQGGFVNLFLSDVDDIYQSPRVKFGQKGDRWGNWGRVLTYNQMLGMIQFEQSRDAPTEYGRPYTGVWSPLLQVLDYTHEGFLSEAKALGLRRDPSTVPLPPCPPQPQCIDCAPCKTLTMSRRLATGDAVLDNSTHVPEVAARSTAGSQSDLHKNVSVVHKAPARKLLPMTGPIEGKIASKSKDKNDRFKWFLYPNEAKQYHMERINWFRNREWLDAQSQHMEVLLYMSNCEMGRPRIIELKIEFGFSKGGGVFYKIVFQTMILKTFFGMIHMMVDAIWFAILLIASIVYGKRVWRSFIKGKFLEYFLTINVLWEGMVLLIGWGCVYCIYAQHNLMADLFLKVESLRDLLWRGTTWEYFVRSESMYDVAASASWQLGYIRFFVAQYLLFLMFRFLVSFAVQPRLATVVQTLRAVLPDLFHFMIVAFPTFLAYVVSGNLIFGRRMTEFATIDASAAMCFRYVMECEYDWDDLAREYYWTSALWIWSYIFLMNLILLNMVLAIILDCYSDVRRASLSGEMAWTTVYNYWCRLRQMQFWVPDIILEETLDEDLDQEMVSRDDFKMYFPDIPQKQLDLMYGNCANDMGWEATQLLDKNTSLKMSGSVKMTTDEVNQIIASITAEDDPLRSFTCVKPPSKSQARKAQKSEGLFLASPAQLKGGRKPHIYDPQYVHALLPGVDDTSADWLRNLSTLMARQKKWILYVNWQLQQLHWQLQHSHLAMDASAAEQTPI
jgi:hypothetical protein